MKRLMALLLMALLFCAPVFAGDFVFLLDDYPNGTSFYHDSIAAVDGKTDTTYIPFGGGGWEVGSYGYVDRLEGVIYADLATAVDSLWAILESSNNQGKTWTEMRCTVCSTLTITGAVRMKGPWTADGSKHIDYLMADAAANRVGYLSDSTWFPWDRLRLKVVTKDTDGTSDGTAESKIWYKIWGIDD